jgi:hypothetical protein
MNVNDLTLGQIKEINSMARMDNPGSMLQSYVGEYVICRSRNEGINAGIVKAIDETGVILTEARRMWFHEPATDASWYEGVANHGLSSDSKVSEPTHKVIVERYSLTICSEEAIASIRSSKSYES